MARASGLGVIAQLQSPHFYLSRASFAEEQLANVSVVNLDDIGDVCKGRVKDAAIRMIAVPAHALTNF